MSFITETDITVISRIENLDEYGLPEGETEKSENVYRAFIKDIDGGVMISYTEHDESGERITSELTVKDGKVELKKIGAITTEMRFAVGEDHDTMYTVGPYSFDARIVTKRIKGAIGRLGGELTIYYELTVGGVGKRVQLRVVA